MGPKILFQRNGAVSLRVFRRKDESNSSLSAYPPQQWMSFRTTNAIERLHREFKRRVKIQCALLNAETAAVPGTY